ncbi:hypothetical protein SDC9_132902 [bioreactor metagenome]|uniref:Uncharacterized protein n=1 Tax=bioreactor metagenome TaxID=1076179 RepID=A0A645D8G2_9ZZZZ
MRYHLIPCPQDFLSYPIINKGNVLDSFNISILYNYPAGNSYPMAAWNCNITVF